MILKVLQMTPEAAMIKNGYGSLPLHVICQRNTKIKAKTTEKLIRALLRGNDAFGFAKLLQIPLLTDFLTTFG